MTCIPVIPGGERTLISSRSANDRLSPADVPADLVRGASALQLAGYAFLGTPIKEAAWKAVDLARAAGIPIVVDTGLPPIRRAKADIERLMYGLSVSILGVDEVLALTGLSELEDGIKLLLERGNQSLAIKMGSRGCLLADRNERIFIPAFPVAAVDATGAGDSFTAGMLFGELTGLSLAAQGVLACAAGAAATLVWGGGPGLPGRMEIGRLIAGYVEDNRFEPLKKAFNEALSILRVEQII
jgi:sugar/nucleoside kinase (ribokinase family)